MRWFSTPIYAPDKAIVPAGGDRARSGVTKAAEAFDVKCASGDRRTDKPRGGATRGWANINAPVRKIVSWLQENDC